MPCPLFWPVVIFVEIPSAMRKIEIRKGLKVGVDELMAGMNQLPTQDLEQLVEALRKLLSERRKEKLPEQEASILKSLETLFPPSVLRRQKQLREKLQEGTITERERQELIQITEFLELKAAERLQLLSKLAELRAVPLKDLLNEMEASGY